MADNPDSDGAIFALRFDAIALAEDLARLAEPGVEALTAFRAEVERRGGLSPSRLMACRAEGRDGTMLGGCVKTYVPWPAGRYGAVMIAVSHPERPLALRAIAFGIRHHPRDSRALTVYQIADRRLRA